MRVLVLENDSLISNDLQRIISYFTENDGEVRLLTNFGCVPKEKLISDLHWCDVILTETTLNDEHQVVMMVNLMTGIKESKQVVFTSSYTVEKLCELIRDNPAIVNIIQHNIGYYGYSEISRDFEVINTSLHREYAKIISDRKEIELAYRNDAINRKTGRKIKVVYCNGFGKPFSTIVPNSIMDELDMSQQDNQPNRGVWVWGNGEPVKLVNDCGIREYEVIGA